MNRKPCAYCGGVAETSDHVIPLCLYPKELRARPTSFITVPCCTRCNSAFSKDEPQFRDILSIAGEPNDAVNLLWGGPIERSFKEKDGKARIEALFEQMVPVRHEGQNRYMVYPAKDERVMRVIRKVIRGLAHHHGLASAVPDNAVWADVLKYEIPSGMLAYLTACRGGDSVLSYSYGTFDRDDFTSAWLLTFFERTRFIGMTLTAPDALDAG